MSRNIISFHALYKQVFSFHLIMKRVIFWFKDGYFMFKASLCNRLYESVVCVSNSRNFNLNIDFDVLDISCL